MKYNKIVPEVIVGLGEHTEYYQDLKSIKKLHIDLEDWLGDDLMKCHPAYIVTENLKNGLQSHKFNGFQFDDIEVTKGEHFEDNFQLDISLPKFYWMKITGKKDDDDLYISPDKFLMADVNFVDYIKQNFKVNFLDVNPEVDKVQEDLLQKLLARAKNRKQYYCF